MEKITFDQFIDWDNRIGVLIRNKEDLKKFSKFIRDKDWENAIDNYEFPVIIHNKIGRIKYTRIYHCDIDSSRDNFRIMQAEIIVTPNYLIVPKEYYNGKIVCVKEGSCFTKGKIYKIIDGTFKDDDGDYLHEVYGYGKRIEKIEDLDNIFRITKFIEIVEDE